MLALVGILVVAVLIITLFVRPTAALGVVFAAGVVVAAIVVSWSDIAQVRAQRAADTAFAPQSASAAVTVPAPDHQHAGS